MNSDQISLDDKNRGKDFGHLSVFLNEMLDFFKNKSLKIFVDGTLGAGGHSEAILKDHCEIEVWIGIDRDSSALEISKKRLLPLLKDKKAHFLHYRFDEPECLELIASYGGFDGAFFDLGVSSMQLDQKERGFSLRNEGPLDMRMNSEDELTAAEIVNTWPAAKLMKIFTEFGQEPKARQAANMILTYRQKQKILTTQDLTKALNGLWKGSHKHPATRIFQALRITVNGELQAIEKAASSYGSLMKEDARMGFISFHSLEDRLVKLGFRALAKEKNFRILTLKPLEPSRAEISRNPRSRSAKLRFVEKIREKYENPL